MHVQKKNNDPKAKGLRPATPGRRFGPRRPLVGAILALAGCAALADEPNPYYVGASEAINHDTNVNRLSNGIDDPQGRGDTYSATSLLGGFDQAYGRQHFRGNATVSYNKYQNHTNLDNTSYGLGAGWDWSTIWDLSGGVNASANQSLAQLNGNTTTQSTNRNLIRSEQIGGNATWGGAGALSVQAAYTHSRVGYSQQSSSSSDSSADTGSLGLYHHLGPTVTTGIAYRVTRTVQPAYFGYGGDSYGRNVDLTGDWRYSVQSGVNARLSYTRQSNSGGGGQDFSGLTGSLGASYMPTGKLSFNAAYARDAGTNGTYYNVPIVTGTTTTPVATPPAYYANSQVSNTLSLGSNYAATAKIGVNASYSYRTANIVSPGTATGGNYTDKLQTASLGASWAVGRTWSVGCNVSHEKRNIELTPSYGYDDTMFGCSAQITLR